MTVDQMRNYICQHPRYKNSMCWKQKVMTMPENQVIAIYHKFKQTNYREEQKKVDARKEGSEYHQIDMFEYLSERRASLG